MKVIIDLSDKFGEVKEQKNIHACLAFATSSAHEYLHGLSQLLSINWLYYQAKHNYCEKGIYGLTLESVVEALKLSGQPFEKVWPYDGDIEFEEWVPPKDPRPRYFAEGVESTFSLNDVISRLENEQPTVIGISETIEFREATNKGGLATVDYFPDSRKVGLHSVLVVGYGEMDHVRYLKVRNSWGPRWGVEGYAWVSETFLRQNVEIALCLRNGWVVR